GLSGSVKFMVGDVINMQLPPADIVVGLGFLDYLTLNEIKALFARMDTKYFVFTFAERKLSFTRMLHILYLLSQNNPKHFYFTKAEIRSAISPKFPDLHFYNSPKISFGCVVTNVPQIPKE